MNTQILALTHDLSQSEFQDLLNWLWMKNEKASPRAIRLWRTAKLPSLRPDDEELEKGPPEEPCRPDGTPVFRRRKLTRSERLQAAADAGFDTWDDYRGNR